MKWCHVSLGLVFAALGSAPALAEMSKGVARSAGSFFAAAMSCEQRERIQGGQTEALRSSLDRYLTPDNKRWIKQGFDKGARRESVFIPETGWTPFVPDEAGCYRVQGVLDDYKMQLNQ